MSVKKRKKDSQIVANKGAGKAQALSAGIAQMQKAGYEFVVIDSKEFVSKGKNTPFNGTEVYGKVCCTIVDGDVKYRA